MVVVGGVCELVRGGEGGRAAVSEADCVGDGVGAAVELDESVVEPVPESEPVLEDDAPCVSDAVGVREIERDRLAVDEGVFGGVDVADAVDDGDIVPLADTVEDCEPVPLKPAVPLALAPSTSSTSSPTARCSRGRRSTRAMSRSAHFCTGSDPAMLFTDLSGRGAPGGGASA